MDLSVGENEENVVHFKVFALFHVCDSLLQDGGKVGRSMQANKLQLLSVLLENILGALDLRVTDVSIQGEAVTYIIVAHVARHASETVDRERFIAVITFEN